MTHADISDTIEAVKKMIRQDLNLDDDQPIEDDMPLLGGEMDLDSLDILMLVTSIEKQYGVKISSDEAGKQAFTSVATLASFIDQQAQQDGAEVSEETDLTETDLSAALEDLPHRAPFRFVSELAELIAGKRGVGHWAVRGEEDFFAGHFPGHPLVPGVLITEALAQISGIVFASGNPEVSNGQLASTEIHFRAPVTPPADILLRSEHEQTHGDLHRFRVAAEVQGQIVAEGRVTLYQPGAGQGGG